MQTKPLFSVLIANYNNGRFLQDAVDSVLAQKYTNWEIILVDDKSTDNSFEIYEKYKNDSRFHVYYNDENRGCGYTKCRCAEMANGEICGFLDPDDTLEKEALEVMVSVHSCQMEVSLVYSRYFIVDNQLNVHGTSEHQCVLPEGVSFLEYGKGAISQFASFKKDYYDKTEGINPFYKRAVDHDLYYLMEEVGKVCFVDKPLYRYRANTGNNISTKGNANAAFLWHNIVMVDACKRRGWDVEHLVLKDFGEYLEEIKNASFMQGADSVRQTKAYKVGRKMLSPFKRLKKNV